MLDLEETPTCPVCRFSCEVELHFGGLVCSACAAFFRRTVALKIRYLCERDNQCKKIGRNCRACRFKACVENARMERNLVQPRKPLKSIPRYILNRQIGTASQEVLRTFVSSNQNKKNSHSKTCLNVQESNEDENNMSKILKRSNSSILKYYMDQVKFGERVHTNTLNIKTKEGLLKIISSQNEISAKACRTCPGVYLLDNQDILILRKYFQFSNVWIESTWRYWITDESVSNNQLDSDIKLVEFIDQVKSTLFISLSQLKLSMFEFAAFKAICIWKLVYHQTSRAMKIVAQEHYACVTKALIDYYQAYTAMNSIDIGIRIGEITLLVTSTFQLYHDMAKLYVHLGLPF